jgi:hypothetical protein
MKPSAPSKFVWVFGMILGIIGIITYFIPIESLPFLSNWFLLAGFAALAVGTTFKGV